MAGTETFIESINIEIVLLRTRSEENTFYENPFYSRRESFYARSINVIVGGLPRAELHSRYNLQSKDALSVGRPWLPRSGAVSSAPSLTSPQRGLLLSSLGNPVKLLFFGMEEPTRESVLFIGTKFSILYTSMYSPAEAATPRA